MQALSFANIRPTTTGPGAMSSARLSAQRHDLMREPHLTGALRAPADRGVAHDWATICLLLMYLFYLAGRTQFHACTAYF